jgi:uncharacterized protein (DUF433 family)
MKTEELIRRFIEEDPYAPGIGAARIIGTGLQVGMVISYLRGADWDIECAASAHAIPREAVEAAQAYYHRHERAVDAWILSHVAGAEAASTA